LASLRKLAHENGAAFIVDATETNCGITGKNFWGYSGECDYLVFGKRT